VLPWREVGSFLVDDERAVVVRRAVAPGAWIVSSAAANTITASLADFLETVAARPSSTPRSMPAPVA
jgi:hypothetical protein